MSLNQGLPSEKSLAVHEAAHFYAGWKFGNEVQSVTIVASEDGSLGKYSKLPGPNMGLDDGEAVSRVRRENQIIEALAGPAAEYHFLKSPFWQTLPHDLSPAVQYACLRHFDGSIADVVAYIQYLWVVTKSFVAEPMNWYCIDRLADELLVSRTLAAAEAIPVLESAQSKFKTDNPSRSQPVFSLMRRGNFDPLVADVLRALGAIPPR